METPDTTSQAAARKEHVEACHELATAAANLKSAQGRYDRAFERYNIAYGAAKQAGVLK